MDEQPGLAESLDKHKLPIALSLVGIVLILGGLFSSGLISGPSTKATTSQDFPKESKVAKEDISNTKQIKVDVSGAVKNPAVYSIDLGSRVEDAILVAGGFLSTANKEYIAKQLNLSQKLADGTKIYIPQEGEQLTSQAVAGVTATSASGTTLISINSASQTDLETLSGVGPVTAQKIIKFRPYNSISELVTKKAVSKSVYEKIKDSITE